MSAVLRDHVEVYLFRRRGRAIEFLTLRRSPGRSLSGVWQPVTGKRKKRETSWAAAIREVREETGLRPERWWALETLTTYFDADRDALVALPLFAAEIGASDEVRLSREHDAMRFLPERRAGAMFLWESQRRALGAVRREVLRGGPLARALELTARPTPGPSSSRAGRGARTKSQTERRRRSWRARARST